MNRFDKYALYYLVGTSPVFFTFMIWASIEYPGVAEPEKLSGGLWNIFGWFFIAWVLDLIYVVVKMLFSKKLRNIVMSRLAGIKERDERESIVAGNAAKFSFLSTFAILLFMLLFSVTNFTVKKYDKPVGQTNGETRSGKALIGFGFKLLDEAAILHEKKDAMETFNYKTFPLSKPVMIFLIMIWQIGSYHLIARKDLRDE
ncbi:MAG: hypothetical protein K2Q18_16550 [Bdellovibrionales bacterium]|nr:hypothetical protein [Bdellovibrionales bacterium]